MLEDVMAYCVFWSFDAAGKSLESKILKQGHYLNLFAKIMFFGMLLCAILEMFEKSDHIYILQEFKNHFWLLVIIKTSIFLTSPSIIIHTCQMIYCTQHLKFQLYILLKMIRDLSEEVHFPEDMLIYNKTFQEQIHFNWKILTAKHQNLIR